ncbi:MAG: MMPL family transporter [Actinobacteria bacterium]|nr:MAG: MMPL family transporter [Actinomycetota bacterium]
MERTNLAGRAGSWSAANWKKALFGAFAAAVVAMGIGQATGHVQMRDSQAASGENAKALAMREAGNFKQPAQESVLVKSATYTAKEPIVQAAIAGVVQNLARQPNVTGLRDPRTLPGNGGLVSRDGHFVLIQFDVRGDPDKAQEKVAPIIAAVAAAQSANPGISIREVGEASANYELNKTFNKDFGRAELMTVPITLIILLAAFGALVAAGLPVLLAIGAVLASLGLFSAITHLYPVDYQSSSAVMLLVGMAVGVDYSLFYLRREREERAAGSEPRPALLRAAATSGQAVLISGCTVLIAMAGLFIAGNRIFTGMALGTMLVVLAAVIGSLTALPAMLAKLGDRVDRGRIPFTGSRKHSVGESRFWGFVLDRVLRHPAASIALAGGLLVLAATPVMSMHTKLPSFTDMPRELPIVKTYKAVVAAFPGAPTPAAVVVRAPNVRAPVVATAIRSLERRAVASGQMFQPITMSVSPDKTVADIAIPLAGNGDNAASLAALRTLRSVVLPATLGNVSGVDYAVAGQTAGTHDFNELMKARMPWVILFVLALAFVLLLATFRSVVIPLTAIALNVLSVGAAYGLLVLIFQHTWAQGVLQFTSNRSITSWLPMFLFVVLFGLSMDYHVFILSRIKELHDGGLSTEEAVSRGIRRTAGTVTSAAIIMVAVFAIFGTLRLIMMKQMGVGLGLAVLIDATVIRGVLLPATMKLLGEWNWYMPRWLDWVPRLTPEDAEKQPPLRPLAH